MLRWFIAGLSTILIMLVLRAIFPGIASVAFVAFDIGIRWDIMIGTLVCCFLVHKLA